MKLSKAQQEVIDLMKDGWALGKDRTFSGGAWLQKGGVGCGGPSKTISISTFVALWKRGLIEHVSGTFPTETWGLKK